LKIEGVRNLPVPVFADPAHLRIGQYAVAIGFGYGGDEPAISAGIVSALNRLAGRAVQTDAKLSPANYGGPLIDIEGRVIGINVPLSPKTDETLGGTEWYDSGIGFAVPIGDPATMIALEKTGLGASPRAVTGAPAK
jgi:serine protease Do